MDISGFSHFGGVYSETAVVRNALAHLGVVAPHTGEPFSEAMLFGISGGVGFTYFTFEYAGHPPSFYLGLAHRYKTHYGEYMQGLYQRLGVTSTVKTTGSQRVAEEQLKEVLEAGGPAIVHVDRGLLPYFDLDGRDTDHALLVFGFDPEAARFAISDLAKVPLTLAFEALASARASYGSLKNRSTTLAPPSREIDLKKAVREGVTACWEQMLNPPKPAKNFGLNGIEKWAGLVNKDGDRKGWPNVFKPGIDLYHALLKTFTWIETHETGGSALRGLYADFLEEAGQALDNPALKEAGSHFREVAQLWRQAAEAALDRSVPLFEEAQALARRRESVFLEQGDAALATIQTIGARQREIEESMRQAFPLNEAQSRQILDSLQAQILAIHEAETEAVRRLQACFS